MSLRDFRYALRSLKKSPGFVAVAVLSLGLGLGLSTAMFALLDAVTHPYVAYRDPDHLYTIRGWFPTRRVTVNPFDVYRAVRDEKRFFESVVPVSNESYALDAGDGGAPPDESVMLFAKRVPSRYFDVVGVQPRLGRALREGDAEQGAAVIGYDLWRRRFAGRRSLQGMTLPVNGRTFTVVGVMPHGMPGTLWLPMSRDAEATGAGLGWTNIIARLRPGVPREAAEAGLAAVARHLTDLYHSPDAPFGFQLQSMRADPMRLSDIHIAMLGASLAVLLIACANLANLMLARGLSKRREIALRLAVGASRSAVVGQMFAESAILTAAGAALGVAASLWGAQVITARVPREMWWLGVVLPQLSWRVFALSAVAAAGSAVLFGLIPAVRVANAVSLDEPLKDGAGTTGRTRQRYSTLVVAEVGLALVLLMGAGLMLRVVQRLTTYQFNFAARQLYWAFARAPQDASGDAQANARFTHNVQDALRAIPGVVDAAAESGASPVGGAVTAEMSSDSTRIVNFKTYSVVTPNYLRTMGLPVLEGRDFLDGDLSGAGVVILNSVAAARLYPRGQAVGRMLKMGAPASAASWLRIVGVCRTAIAGRPEEMSHLEPEIYVVRATSVARDMRVIVRAAPDDPKVAVAVGRRLQTLGPGLVYGVYPYLYWYEGELRSRAFLAKLFVTMGAFALVLAAVGIYGVLAYAVNRRLREFAVRVALGAQRSDLLNAVLHDGLVMTLAGTGLGAFVALWSSYLLETFLEDIYPTDVLTLVLAESVLIAVTVAACLAPAFRAMRADPIEILRAT